MSSIGQRERITQNRIVELFRTKLQYEHLGNWEERPNNSNIEEELVRKFLIRKGYREDLIKRALQKLRDAAVNYNESLYTNNKAVYQLLRYGVSVVADIGELSERVELIDWKNPEQNDFAIAEEVTIQGNREKRPDIVLYVNGIASGVLELKRSVVSIGDGIRQNLVNQQKEFIESFFSTVQLVMAGNDTEGLRYGTIKTPEKYFLNWKEDVEDGSVLQLDKYLLKLCNKKRLLELVYDFVLFDGGIKKLPRHHQYFGVKAAQEHIRRRESGIIWHTQGSGKSIVMVYLAKWILENNPHARVVVITDREELDKQIKDVFEDAGEEIYRTRSGADLMHQLGQAKPRLLCSLVHKFGRREEEDLDRYIRQLEANPARTFGEIFVFVDECHRTQSGKLHKIMKAILRDAVFIGFTGTPLLQRDKQTSLEVFGKYIHTYKFNEAVKDEVIRDLVYEARDVDQHLTSQSKVDEWFEVKTKGLNDFQKSELKKRWGTMQQVLSSQSRLQRIVNDIVFDFSVKPRLSSGAGNAILVAGSIHEACRYYKLFQSTELKGKCALITSYNPTTRDIVTEDTGANTETQKEEIYKTYVELLNGRDTEAYEDDAKNKFKKEPANMKLLIVVAKLLTGFDAPPCSYLYIDKKMEDHGLFQAICRVNRLDTDDKQFGYIVDYMNLFKAVESAVAVYTAELDYDKFKKEDVDVLLKDRAAAGRERLDNALEELAVLCGQVEPPRDTLAHIRYFCGNPEVKDDLKATENRRMALYKQVVVLIRAYASIADDMVHAGYSDNDVERIKKKIDESLKLREEIKKSSGETLDLKTYEADMRHLIDHYIQAEDPRKISPFDGLPLIDLIVKTGIHNVIANLPAGIRAKQEAVAEVIANNVRSKIIKDHLIDPAFFEEMSKLLDEVIKERKNNAISYEEYLKKIANLAKKVSEGKADDTPTELQTPAQRALYNNLSKNKDLALQLHKKILEVKPDAFRGNDAKERIVKRGLYEILMDIEETERIFNVVREQAEY